MSSDITILMLGGAKRVAIAEQLIRAGKDMKKNVRIYSHELSPFEPIASVGKIIVGGKYSDLGSVEDICDIIKTYKVDIVLPFIDPAIEIAAECKLKFPNLCIPVSSIDVIRAMFDKVQAARWFEKHNIAIPQTYTPQNIKFPAIFKPRTGSASHGIIIATNKAKFDEIEDIDNYLIQEYISNREEYTVDCYVGMSDNEIKCTVPRIRLATAGGEVIRTQTCRIPQLISLSENVLKALDLRGAITLQFIYDKDTSKFLLMEINPRLGGGVICSIMAGADIAKMIIQESLNEEVAPCRVWRDGALMARYFKEVMFYNDGIK
ncbi:MAG: ATP-grasp domain-containing protein [Muribaculaceae bacterium]